MPNQPNIVFIMTDQQRLDTIAALGYDHMITPHLDRLVNNGAAFENMYVTGPVCSSSRASLFSGTYPHTNGVFRNDEPWSYCWVKELASVGYRCVNVGKMHTWPVEGAFGFHERHVTENKDRDHPDLPFYLDNWDKALHARGAYKPSRVTYRNRADHKERLGAFVWAHDEDYTPMFLSLIAPAGGWNATPDQNRFSCKSAYRDHILRMTQPRNTWTCTMVGNCQYLSATMISIHNQNRCSN